MLILKIKQDKKKKKVSIVQLNNDQSFRLYNYVIKKFGLRKGDQLNDAKFKKILFCNDFYKAKDVALKYFSYRHRSEFEIQAKLENLKFKPEIIKEVISNLKSVGLINDYEFADNFTRSTLNKRLISKSLMKEKLLERKISKDIINEVLDKHYKDVDEFSIAKKIALKQLKKYQKTNPEYSDKKLYPRITNFLARRGFPWSIITTVTREILNINSFDEI